MPDYGPADPYAEVVRPRTPLPLLYLDQIAPVLDGSDFVQGVLMEGSAVVIYGESTAGKTFFTTDLALRVAAGMRWNGRRVDQAGVVYVAMEGGTGFRNRVHAFMVEHQLEGVLLPFAAIPASVNLLDADADMGRLLDAIEAAAQHMGLPVKLVVLDTLSRAMAGGNENDSADMGQLVRHIDLVRERSGACVLAVHHSVKDSSKGARGHSLLRAALDTEIEVRADDDTGIRTATVVKQREMAKGDTFTFTLKSHLIGTNRHGEDVTTAVVVPGDGDQGGERTSALTPDERGWLKDVASFFDDPARGVEGVRPSPGSGVVRGATRAEIRAWLIDRGRLGVAGTVAGGDGLTATERSQLSRYLNRLKDKGKLGVFKDWVWVP